MNPTRQASESDALQHPYPMVRAGGLFLVFFGVGIITDLVLSGAFMAGCILAVMSLMFSKALSFGKPKRFQLLALVLAVALELVLFFVLIQLLPADAAESIRLMWILLIVGVHFLPMAITFGPRFGILGVLCIMNALTALVLRGAVNELFLFVDGAMKLGFGIWLFKTQPRRGEISPERTS